MLVQCQHPSPRKLCVSSGLLTWIPRSTIGASVVSRDFQQILQHALIASLLPRTDCTSHLVERGHVREWKGVIVKVSKLRRRVYGTANTLKADECWLSGRVKSAAWLQSRKTEIDGCTREYLSRRSKHCNVISVSARFSQPRPAPPSLAQIHPSPIAYGAMRFCS